MTAPVPTQEVALLELGGDTFVVTHDARGYCIHPVCRVHQRVGEAGVTLARARDWQCPQCLADMTRAFDGERYRQLLPQVTPCS